MRFIFSVISILHLILLVGCNDLIDLDVPIEERNSIAVNGKLVKSNPSKVEVKVERVFDFTSKSRNPVTAASVTLYELDGGSRLLDRTDLNFFTSNIYDDDTDISIESNRFYYINVIMNDGAEFISEPAILNPLSTNGKVEVNVIDAPNLSKPLINYTLILPHSVNILGERSAFTWSMTKFFRFKNNLNRQCYNAETVHQAKKPIAGGTNNTNAIATIPIYEEEVNWQYAEAFYFDVYIESLSSFMKEHFTKISFLNEQNGLMFEPPAGQVSTNIRHRNDIYAGRLYGSFYATELDTVSVCIGPEMVGFPNPFCPRPAVIPSCMECCQDCTGEPSAFWRK